MYIKDKNGCYLKQYSIQGGDIFALHNPTIKVTRITEKEFATEFPDTSGIFDLLELLQEQYPDDKWIAI